jgi:asparagine synthase (glutamine-hydrolysing)
MSIIFGVRTGNDAPVEDSFLRNLALATARYAPDGTFVQVGTHIGMGFQPYYTHERSKLETRPASDRHGNLLAFDGRLDDHEELRKALGLLPPPVADSSLILAAFERWGEDCFSRFVGDWALALWDNRNRSLYLARDHAGTRTLFYDLRDDRLLWSTYLETLISTQSVRSIDEEYVATFLAMFPLRSLTPYAGIRTVPPGHYVMAKNGNLVTRMHWRSFRKDALRLRSDSEYEERFRSLFRSAVARRVGPGSPILAELSGGMDSSSIVCMADEVRRAPEVDTIVDTVSYYNDAEPSWDEKPYFTAIEELRGKPGVHIDVAQFERNFKVPDTKCILPGPDGSSLERGARFAQLIDSRRYRVILSGVGGDEVLGGVPTPYPELADYLLSGRVTKLIRRAVEWSSVKRATLLGTLTATMRFAAQTYFPGFQVEDAVPPWLTSRLARLAKDHSSNGMARITLPPTAICNGNTWWSIMESLPHLSPGLGTRYEYRYPYLDRDLVDFLFTIPREQLIRPGRRRSLMRRALYGIVPALILERPQKAYPTRTVLGSIDKLRHQFLTLASESRLAQMGFIDPRELLSRIGSIQVSDPKWWPAITRTVLLEIWLRSGRERVET